VLFLSPLLFLVVCADKCKHQHAQSQELDKEKPVSVPKWRKYGTQRRPLATSCKMVIITDNSTPAVLKEEDRYEGKHIDANIAAGKSIDLWLVI
jgi:hypothetical protein